MSEALPVAAAADPRPDPSELRPAAVLELLKEYRRKVAALARSASGPSSQSGTRGLLRRSRPRPAAAPDDRLRHRFRLLQPPLLELARDASSLIENTTLDRVTKIELRLRLAEFESELESAQAAIKSL